MADEGVRYPGDWGSGHGRNRVAVAATKGILPGSRPALTTADNLRTSGCQRPDRAAVPPGTLRPTTPTLTKTNNCRQ